MSRTRKDRPYWVLHNDPKSPRKAHHHHLKTVREKVGEEPVYRDDFDGKPFVWYARPLYKRWVETVECDLDKPYKQNDGFHGKNCSYYLDWYPENYRSNKSMQRLTNGALRSKVRQQLHTALICQDPNEPANWWDVDIHSDSKYAKSGWWG